MDKVKIALGWLLRNRFWVLCGMVAVASLATWFVAWRALDAEREEREQKIKSAKSSIESVLTTTATTGDEEITVDAHPNQVTQEKMDAKIEDAEKAALEAWQVRYDQQKEVLVVAPELPDQVRLPLEQHQPMEKPIGGELMDRPKRQSFREFVVRRMPNLARDTIGATWMYDVTGKPLTEESSRGGGSSGKSAAAPAAQTEDLVRWSETNQKLWLSKVSEFEGFDGNEDTEPTSQQMLALQQDFWVLEAILKIIGKVNEGFIANDLAPIERLDHILVGREAMAIEARELKAVSFKVDAANTKAAASKSGGGRTPPRNTGGPAPSRSSRKAAPGGAAFQPNASTSPFHGRYVDRDYRQLNIAEIEQAIAGGLSARSYLAVAKRIPVRVAVRMDERRIDDFLAAAANSPFTFEVRQIRINQEPDRGERQGGGAGGGGGGVKQGPERGGGGPGSGGGLTQDGGGQDTGSGGGAGGSSGDEGPFVPETRRSFDVTVEFIGIVKIYNPPDPNLFKNTEEESDDSDVAADDAASGTVVAGR